MGKGVGAEYQGSRTREEMTLKAFDFFCGAGGLTRGLLDAGIKVISGFDIDNMCRASFEFNNPKVRFVPKDIRDVTPGDLKKADRTEDFEKMLFAGCAPCQPFSQAKKNKRDNPFEATLLGDFGRLIQTANPGVVLMENVPGIARVPGYSTFKRFLRILDDNGYKYVYDVVDAKNFGVPQTRRRLVLIASRIFTPYMPEPKYGATHKPCKTVRQAISHFPPISAGDSHPTVPNHVAASITPLNISRLEHTPADGGGRRDWPAHLMLDCHAGGYCGHTDVYGRMAWEKQAPTLTGKCNSISNGRYGHPEQNRAISLREAAALQSFPDGYVFFGSNKHVAQQIGNAVPVRMAEEFGKHILEMFHHNTSKYFIAC